MGTKWKGSLTIIAIALLLAYGLGGLFTVFTTASGFTQKSYFQTNDFQNKLSHYADRLYRYVLQNISEEEAIGLIKVTDNEVEELQRKYEDTMYSLLSEEEHMKLQIAAQNISEVDHQRYLAELETAKAIVHEEETARKEVKNNKIKKVKGFYEHRYNSDRQAFLKQEAVLDYYFTNVKTNKVYTNMDITGKERNDLETYFYSSHRLFSTEYMMPHQIDITYNMSDYMVELVEVNGAEGEIFKGWFAVPETNYPSNEFLRNYKLYNQKQLFLFIYVGLSIVAIGLAIYLYRKQFKKAMIALGEISFFGKIPLDLRLLLMVISCVIIFILGLLNINSFEQFFYDKRLLMYIRVLVQLTGFAAAVMIFLYLIVRSLIMSNRTKSDFLEQWQRSIMYWLISRAKDQLHMIKNAFYSRSAAVQLMLLLLIFFALGLIFIAIIAGYDGDMAVFYFVCYMALTVLVGLPITIAMFKQLAYLSKLVQVTQAWTDGNWNEELPEKGRSVLKKLATSINTLKSGVKSLQFEQVKSERLKTELITNVSHDLRTPLTSIITYTELLKRDNLSEQEQADYVEIIDRKSKRLKVLIDDLFEVSKMASGNVELHLEKVDVVQLLQQALAEHNEIIQEAGLQMRLSINEKPLYSIVDGKKMWRVFDNLIENMVKYSLEKTRAYISITSVGDSISIVFKNISKYELNDSAEELFERFKRGDDSRQTDGSGLGLAIAQSIVDLHEGSLELDVDGDLFKVTIVLRLHS
ncbi:histidine kinase dimerization/phospho-acceptor domain-containing protein [Paenibacillus yanchengensis]|uniref:histidine kinase n=1 Tax=Paenibacillus yanchengensis TaxID=2035833 RepID=A0ABW4YQY3_9BACL